MDANALSSLIQVGTAGAVIAVVVVFLNFLKDERAARAADVLRFTEALDKRDVEFSKRNDAVVRALELQAAKSDTICKALEGLTASIMQHDTRTQPAVERIMEGDSSSRRRRATDR
jgi:hypothetical protein